MAMTSHIRSAVRNLLDSWEKDATSSYKDSFIISDGCLKHAQDEKEKAFSRPDSTAEKERAEVLYLSQSSICPAGCALIMLIRTKVSSCSLFNFQS
jgi:hypothetical protein